MKLRVVPSAIVSYDGATRILGGDRMQEAGYTFLPDLAKEASIPEKGILSRTIQNDQRSKIVLFGFAAGEELSEHTSSMPAVLQFLEGRAELTLGADRFEVEPGCLVHMPPKLPHAIRAKSGVLMLLILMKSDQAA